MIGNCSENGGPKWITKEVTHYSKIDYGHSHHPSTGQHMIRGEVLTYNYLHILLDAIYTIQDEQISNPTTTINDIHTSKYIFIIRLLKYMYL